MKKSEARARMKALRSALTKEETAQRSALICDALLSADCVKSAETVMIYMSAFNEADTAPVIERLRKNGVRIVVPVCRRDTCTIIPSYLDGALKKSSFGIMEPERINEADIDGIDVAIVPGLAFDEGLARCGFGKGYYDRFLCRSRAYRIGICYDFQIVDELETDEHDIPMDMVISESRILYREQSVIIKEASHAF